MLNSTSRCKLQWESTCVGSADAVGFRAFGYIQCAVQAGDIACPSCLGHENPPPGPPSPLCGHRVFHPDYESLTQAKPNTNEALRVKDLVSKPLKFQRQSRVCMSADSVCTAEVSMNGMADALATAETRRNMCEDSGTQQATPEKATPEKAPTVNMLALELTV